MKKKILKIMAVKAMVLGLLFIPTFVISPEQKVNIESETEVTVLPLDNEKVGAGMHEVIKDEPIDIYMYATTTVKVRREPAADESNVVGLIPAGAEMLWIENVDDMWSKVEINDAEYFICKDYITTIAPDDVISILNIEPTHEGVYFVNSNGEEVANPNYVSLGTYRLTAYCSCTKCCGKWSGGPTASGVMPRANHTIAVDTSVIPFGTRVIINGRTYVAEDTGSGIDGKCIDIYFEDHGAALQFGLQYKEVFTWKY